MFNKLVVGRWHQQEHERHLLRLESMRSDSAEHYIRYRSVPPNAKKRQLKLEKIQKIAKDNSLLLERIVDISNSASPDRIRNSKQADLKRTLNGTTRKQELLRITHENRKLLERLITQQSYYNFNKWEKDDKDHRKYVEFASSYPYVFDISEKKEVKRNRSVISYQAAKRAMLPPLEPIPQLDTVSIGHLPSVMQKSMIIFPRI